MRLFDTIKNNAIEIIAICTIVIGATSGVFVTLYEIQIKNIRTRYEADLSHLGNECEKNHAKYMKLNGNDNSSCDDIVSKYQSEIAHIRSDYESNIAELKINCSKPVGTVTEKTFFDINGNWDFQVNATASVNYQGKKGRNSSAIEIRMNLIQRENDDIRGEYVWVTGNGCPKANISGTIKGNDFKLIIHYVGSCCGGAKMTFEGKMTSSGMIEGIFEPYGIPPNPNCNIWWANISGIKSD